MSFESIHTHTLNVFNINFNIIPLLLPDWPTEHVYSLSESKHLYEVFMPIIG